LSLCKNLYSANDNVSKRHRWKPIYVSNIRRKNHNLAGE
jgi:hypothetical protein